MINTKFIEDGDDHTPDLVAATPWGNRLDEHLQCLFFVRRSDGIGSFSAC